MDNLCTRCEKEYYGIPYTGGLCSDCATQPQQKRPFIEFTRTKKIETQLTRIATALEQLLIEAYGYHTDIPTTDTSGPETQVMYTDHDEHDIQDILDDMKDQK